MGLLAEAAATKAELGGGGWAGAHRIHSQPDSFSCEDHGVRRDQQGYVYLGDQPILSYASGGTASYYLEDGMGSVIGLAPASSPGTGNTTRLFYDGFGNSRATNGPAPTIASGTGGDFRFHGAWFETGSGLYNMRAREYDARTARFMSRDPDAGDPRMPETVHPYNYANANPFIYTDPDGRDFTLVSMSISEFIDVTLDSLVDVAIAAAKQKLEAQLFQSISSVVLNQLGNLYPPLGDVLKEAANGNYSKAGRNFEAALKKQICGAIGANNKVASMIWFEPALLANGDADGNGFNCPNLSPSQHLGKHFYPDFVLSEYKPKDVSGKNPPGKSIIVGDVKLSGNSLYNQYVKGSKIGQFNAIANYAGRHCYTRTAVFLTVFSGQKSKLQQVQALLGRDGLEKGVVAVVISVRKNK